MILVARYSRQWLISLVMVFAVLPASGVAQKNDRSAKEVAWWNVGAVQRFWMPKAANSDELLVDSLSFRVISETEPLDLTVAMAFEDTGDYLAAYVYISNVGKDRLNINPADFRLAYWKNKEAFLAHKVGALSESVSPESIAAKYKSHASLEAFFVRLAGGMATKTVTTQERGTVTVTGTNGSAATGDYSGTSTTTIPDQQARISAGIRSKEILDNANHDAGSIARTALSGNTLFPGQHAGGWVYFQRKKFALGDVMIRVGVTPADPGIVFPRTVDYCFMTAPAK